MCNLAEDVKEITGLGRVYSCRKSNNFILCKDTQILYNINILTVCAIYYINFSFFSLHNSFSQHRYYQCRVTSERLLTTIITMINTGLEHGPNTSSSFSKRVSWSEIKLRTMWTLNTVTF